MKKTAMVLLICLGLALPLAAQTLGLGVTVDAGATLSLVPASRPDILGISEANPLGNYFSFAPGVFGDNTVLPSLDAAVWGELKLGPVYLGLGVKSHTLLSTANFSSLDTFPDTLKLYHVAYPVFQLEVNIFNIIFIDASLGGYAFILKNNTVKLSKDLIPSVSVWLGPSSRTLRLGFGATTTVNVDAISSGGEDFDFNGLLKGLTYFAGLKFSFDLAKTWEPTTSP
ncbi:MAG: hypothetical protein LBT11_01255 [Treponema sp.]|jgi:hypothetical protein|nr:hypothetical protein [Treponema sp.]